MKRWLLASLLLVAAVPARAAAPRAAALPALEVRALALPASAALPASMAALPPLFAAPAGAAAAPLSGIAALPALPQLAPARALAMERNPQALAADAAGPGAHAGAHAGAVALATLQTSALEGAGALGKDATAAGARSLSSRSFDGEGSASSPAGPVDGGASGAGQEPPTLPPYLDSPEAEHSAWIASVVKEARRTKTGRAVLGRVERLARTQGHPVMILVSRIGNSGEFVFDHEVVTMDAGHQAQPPEAAAPVLIHELLHVLQLAQGLPADAFEMELEAYLAQFQVTEQLGLKPPKGSFHASAWRRFKNDLDRFVSWLKKEYDGNLAIVGASVDEYAAQLEQRLVEAQAKHERLETRAAVKRRVVERMLKTNQPAGKIEQYRLDELAPLEDKLRISRRELDWLERDLLLLRTPDTRARYQRYAAQVLKKARAYHQRVAAR